MPDYTDAERLAVAEEICASRHIFPITLHDLNIFWFAPHFVAQVGAYNINNPTLASVCCMDYRNPIPEMIDCILAARANLAAERDTTLPEEAKRWRDALKTIARDECNDSRWYRSFARKALEQGANP